MSKIQIVLLCILSRNGQSIIDADVSEDIQHGIVNVQIVDQNWASLYIHSASQQHFAEAVKAAGEYHFGTEISERSRNT